MLRKANTWLHRLFCMHVDTAKKTDTGKTRVWLECMSCGWTSTGWQVK
jgi:hypothetical protein